ncbi:MAG TPA: nucleotide exchange factor GrpE [Acidimicrobiales bacterium]
MTPEDEFDQEPSGRGQPAGAAGPFPAPDGDGPGPIPDTVEQALAEMAPDAEAPTASDLELIQRQRDDYLDDLRRLQADFENFKKRTLKQQTEHLQRAAQGLVEQLLPVLDAADLAIAHGGGEAVEQVAGLLLGTLGKEGLDRVEPKAGEPFDPTSQEAVAHEPGDTGHQEVADVLRAGYRWKGVLLRPAMVKVRG